MTERSFESMHARAAFTRREEQWTHVTYNSELTLLEIIKHGEVDRISYSRVKEMFPAHNGHLSNDPRRQAIYEFIASITLVTRFAVEGGVNTEQAYTLSDAYIKSADETKDADEVHALYAKMLIDFATKVKRARSAQKTLSLPVTRAMEYIDSHLHEKITLNDVAAAVKRNPAYLCAQFKEETGTPLSQYINREKMEEAKQLLRDGELTVTEVAATLAYGSQSYFAKLFYAHTGETPTEHRRRQAVEHR